MTIPPFVKYSSSVSHFAAMRKNSMKVAGIEIIERDSKEESRLLFEERLPPAMRVRRKKLYFCLEKKNLQ